MERGGLVYRITNKVNGKIYIGRTSMTLNRRFSRHLSDSRRHFNSRIAAAIRKHGIDSFIIEQIDKADTHQELVDLETSYIKKLKVTDPKIGYNIIENGYGGYPPVLSKETREIIRQKLIGYKHTEEAKKRMSEGQRKSKTPELNKRVSDSLMGEKNHFYGKKHTKETRIKMKKSKNVGEANAYSKLNWEKVREIRALKGVEKIDFIAEKFGLSRGCIEKVLYNQTWREDVKN